MVDENTGNVYLIKFTQWTEGNAGGGFTYERTRIFELTDFYRPSNSPEVVDVISEGLIIKRNNIRGIFNSVLETSYDNNNHTSPKGTRWSSQYTDPANATNKDYSNVRERVYDTWREAVDANPPNILGLDLIMHDLSTDLYWLITFYEWGIGDNGDLGNVGYTRQLLPLCEGIQFADGSLMTTASTSSNGAVVDVDGNVIIADSSNNTVDVGPGSTQLIQNFSGMLIVNDHYDGGVELWIAGGGDGIMVSHTTTAAGNSTLTINSNGYEWTNVDNLNGPFTFTVIKTRQGS